MDVQDILKGLRKLNDMASKDNPKISEHDFVKYLLPVLVDYQNSGDVSLQIWLEIAGNPHQPIDVFDIKGELLFTVPPILARVPSIDRPLESTTTSVGELAYLYGQKARAEHPAVADAWLETVMRSQVIPADQEQVLGYMKEWIKIYRRYNLPMDRLIGSDEKLGKLVSESSIDSGKSEPEISGEFDDF